MLSILLKALGFIFIIAIGLQQKQKGIFKKEHGAFLSTVIMNITLPCTFFIQ